MWTVRAPEFDPSFRDAGHRRWGYIVGHAWPGGPAVANKFGDGAETRAMDDKKIRESVEAMKHALVDHVPYAKAIGMQVINV